MELIAPAGVTFGDLKLEREPVTDRLLFLPAPLGAVCLSNGLDPEQILADEDQSCALICAWYVAHRTAGGERDEVVERIVAEINAAQNSGVAALQLGRGQQH